VLVFDSWSRGTAGKGKRMIEQERKKKELITDISVSMDKESNSEKSEINV
jgi:hypothetical protein